jgi:branched-chain amino acid transport system permease protein
VVGAFFLVAMQHYLAQLGSWVTVVQGIIFVVCVLVFRRGIVGTIAFYAAPPRDVPSGEKPTEVGAAAARGTS